MIPEIAKEFDSGAITPEHVEGLLDEVYGPDETDERIEARGRVIKDGNIVKFQLVSLNAKARAALGVTASAIPPASPPVAPELLKDVPEPVYDHPRPDLAAEIKKRVGIIAGVRLWGKPQPRIHERGVEGIKVRCPYDSHTDLHPSAWVNTEKGTWYCGKCTVGGDVIDFYAARRRGFMPDDFHRGSQFGEIVNEMGEELGLRVGRDNSSGDFYVEDDANPLPSAAPDSAPGPEPVVERPEPTDITFGEPDTPTFHVKADLVVPPSDEAAEPVTITEDEMLRGVAIETYQVDFDIEPATDMPGIDWRTLDIPQNTFLHNWMEVNTGEFDWIPSEFFLALGLQAIGMACGHTTTSKSYGAPLTGSLLLVLAGHSGTGKTTAVSKLRRMLSTVTGPKFDPEIGTGIKPLSSPGSAEALVASVYHEIADPTDATIKLEVGITTWLFEDEFASLVERARRRGGGHLKQRVMQLHDFVKWKDDPEVVIDEFSLTSGKRIVHDTFFSGCFLTQPDALCALTEHVDLVSGFLNRMVPAFGSSGVRRLAARDPIIDPDPPYHGMFRDLWMRARAKRTHVPFRPDSLALVDAHPFFAWAEKASAASSMYARLNHNTLRFAFLLAVNEGAEEILPSHIERATLLGVYLQGCIGKLMGEVIRIREDDCAEKIVRFAKSHYDRTGEWPNKRLWAGDRSSYREYTGDIRQKAMELLVREERLVEITLVRGATRSKVLVVPDGPWAAYSSSHGKTFKWEEVYSDA